MLIRAAFRRVLQLTVPERVLVVTAQALAESVRTLLPELPAANLLTEPCARNTAPCVAWASAHVHRSDPEARLVVVPADQYVEDDDACAQVMRTAIAAAEGDRLITVGLEPTRAETGYGYIELGRQIADSVYQALRFVEKPERGQAQHYLESGRFLWNSGMFFFEAGAALAEIRRQLPELTELLDAVSKASPKQALERARKAYSSLPSVSLDHGVMEGARNVLVVRGEFGWADVGSWNSAWRLARKDVLGNATTAKTVAVDSQDCYVEAAQSKVVALVGLSGVVVVDTPDALLVLRKDQAQRVRQLVEALRNQGDDEVL